MIGKITVSRFTLFSLQILFIQIGNPNALLLVEEDFYQISEFVAALKKMQNYVTEFQ